MTAGYTLFHVDAAATAAASAAWNNSLAC